MSNHIIDLSVMKGEKPLFFGDTDKVIRVDTITNRVYTKLKEDSEGNTWFTKEVSYDNDRSKFDDLPDHVKRMFQLNIGYQTVMDSGISNAYLDTLRKMCSDPGLKILYTRIGMEEVIHSESYSYALNQLFGADSEAFLDIIYTDEFIKGRMNLEVDAYDKLDDAYSKHLSDPLNAGLLEECKKCLLKALVVTYFMEGVKFPFSFFLSFTINKSYDSSIQGIANLLKLIAHDEFNIHVPTHLHTFKLMRTQKIHGFTHLFRNGWFKSMTSEVAEITATQEFSWLHYLLRDGSIPGFNEKIGEHIIKFWTNLRLKGLKLPIRYEGIESNDLIEWFDSYKDINKSNTAGQEADNLSYIKGGLTDDLNDGEW